MGTIFLVVIVVVVVYADDAAGIGKLVALRRWWDEVCDIGPHYGYFPKASKTWLIVKEDHYSEAELIFAGSGVRLTKGGRPHLGAPLGTSVQKQVPEFEGY